jgi:hypothetical protein
MVNNYIKYLLKGINNIIPWLLWQHIFRKTSQNPYDYLYLNIAPTAQNMWDWKSVQQKKKLYEFCLEPLILIVIYFVHE